MPIKNEKYDEEGRLIYYIDENNNEHWLDYNEDDTKVHRIKMFNKFDYYITYDKDNKQISRKELTTGLTESFLYNEDGKLEYIKSVVPDPQGNDIIESWFLYTEEGKICHKYDHKDSYELWTTYDNNDKKIKVKDSNNIEEKYDYDESGKLVHFYTSKDNYEYHEWKEYNEQGLLSCSRNSEGKEDRYLYDENGKLISFNSTIVNNPRTSHDLNSSEEQNIENMFNENDKKWAESCGILL